MGVALFNMRFIFISDLILILEKEMKKIFCLVGCLVFGSVNAASISGDFRTESDLNFGAGPKVYENVGALVGGHVELTSSDFSSNPQGWGGGEVNIDLDPLTNTLTLDSQDTWDFNFFDMWLTNITFDASEIITGISLISGNITDRGITPSLSFTDDSIHIAYHSSDSSGFDFTGTSAQFQITIDAVSVPEPTSLSLLALGLAGIGFSRKKYV